MNEVEDLIASAMAAKNAVDKAQILESAATILVALEPMTRQRPGARLKAKAPTGRIPTGAAGVKRAQSRDW